MITNGYATLADLKTRLGITDSSDDTTLEDLITSLSRQIDDYTATRFYSTSETRVFAPRESRVLLLPPGSELLSIDASGLMTDRNGDRVYESVWTTSDYDLWPLNNPREGRPYWAIVCTPLSLQYFPVGLGVTVQISGVYGYSSSTPAVIRDACLLQAQLLYQTVLASGHGTAGAGEYAQAVGQVGLHPFVRRQLDYYRVREAA